MTAKRYLLGLPRTPDYERDVNVLRTRGNVATVADDYTESGEARYSISTGRRLKDDGKPHPWDFWRLEMPTGPEPEAVA